MMCFPADRGKRTEMVRSVILPEDLIAEILSWLPVKSLMQFQCVCKSWHKLIANPNFISQHLNNYYNNNPNNGLLLAVAQKGSKVRSHHLRLIAPDGMLLSLPILPNQPLLESDIVLQRIIGPCNGLIFVCYSKGYVLWNPAIQDFKILPPPPSSWHDSIPPNVSRFYSHGFGLDPITNDYKVVIIRVLFEDDDPNVMCPFQALVYSLADDSWKHLGDLKIRYFFYDAFCYTYLNGKYYWKVRRKVRVFCDVIMSFDMAKEVFQEMKGPDYYQQGYSFDHYHDCLALHNDSIALYVFKEFNQCLDIWVMDGGCWIKKITAGPFLGVRWPIGYWKDGQVFLESGNDSLHSLLLCDPSTGEIRDLQLKRNLYSAWVTTVIYKDSLVSVSRE